MEERKRERERMTETRSGGLALSSWQTLEAVSTLHEAQASLSLSFYSVLLPPIYFDYSYEIKQSRPENVTACTYFKT
jgi:hypothetical protein